MSKHTPGPWIAIGKYVRKMDCPGVWPDWNVCEVNMNAAMDNSETGKANANLIAAAPGLLAECEYWLHEGRFLTANCDTYNEAIERLQDIIAEAKGEL